MVAIFGSFSLFIFLLFFKNELQNESRMTQKMIIFAKWSTPPHFAKMLIFAFIILSFSHSIFIVLSNSAPMPNPLQWQLFSISVQLPSINDDAPPSPLPPPPQLHHHWLSPLPCPHPHQLTPSTTANQPHQAQTMQVVWALGNIFFCQVIFFHCQLTNLFICFF